MGFWGGSCLGAPSKRDENMHDYWNVPHKSKDLPERNPAFQPATQAIVCRTCCGRTDANNFVAMMMSMRI